MPPVCVTDVQHLRHNLGQVRKRWVHSSPQYPFLLSHRLQGMRTKQALTIEQFCISFIQHKYATSEIKGR